MRLFYFPAFVVLILSAPVVAGDGSGVAEGKKILQDNCNKCHAIDLRDDSTHAEAPPFRVIIKKYPAEYLAESLAEGIVSGHPDMPEFTFEPDEIGAIIAYLNELGSRAQKP